MANRSLPAARYFGAFFLIVAVLYGLVFLGGSSHTPLLGLDLQGGTTVTLTARTPNHKAPAQADLELARQIIEQRVNGLGVAGAKVVTEGSSNIVISVPGDNGDQARQLGQTAQLRFRPVLQSAQVPSSATGQRRKSRPPSSVSMRITSAPICAIVMPPSGAATKAEISTIRRS